MANAHSQLEKSLSPLQEEHVTSAGFIKGSATPHHGSFFLKNAGKIKNKTLISVMYRDRVSTVIN